MCKAVGEREQAASVREKVEKCWRSKLEPSGGDETNGRKRVVLRKGKMYIYSTYEYIVGTKMTLRNVTRKLWAKLREVTLLKEKRMEGKGRS